jgi:ATP/maltotriose-dependent transcriptional regulator MalT
LWGEFYAEKQSLNKAESNFTKALEYGEEAKSKRILASSYANLGNIAMLQNNYEKALAFNKEALSLEREINNKSGIIASLVKIAQTNYSKKKYVTALESLSEAEELCTTDGLLEHLPEVYKLYYMVHKAQKNHHIALSYFEQFSKLKDSLNGVEIKEKIADLELKHQSEKQRQQILLLNEENKTRQQKISIRNYLILSMALLVTMVLILALLLRQNAANKLQKMESELQNYILQLNDLIQPESEQEFNAEKLSEKYDLTERETEVLTLLAQGMKNTHIAEKIYVSTNTIKYHIKNIYLKLDVRNRVEALNKVNV